MTAAPKILAFAGSTRSGSFNKKLIRCAAAGAEGAGAAVTLIDLRDYALPLYDGDLEDSQGLPENAVKLKALFAAHQGLLISAPEYNGSFSAVLKNAIDWVSRQAPDEKPLAGYRGKVAGLVACSPGSLGGLRGLVHLRQVLTNLNVLVIPEQRAVNSAMEAFDGADQLKDAGVRKGVEAIGARLVDVINRLSA